jgi:putative addiction module component (TIGR02574 family)
MTTTSEILNAAMALSAEERAEVAHKLLLSLEPGETDPNVEQAWTDEVRRRLLAIREGRTTLRDWDDALEDIRRSLTGKEGA